MSNVSVVTPAGEVAEKEIAPSREVRITLRDEHYLALLHWKHLEVISRKDGVISARIPYFGGMHVRDDFNIRVTSVVLMGQGEPFANYDATLEALRKLNSSDGAGIGARHLTVSTCGIIPGIARFAKEPEQFTLAVSLHSAVQKTRDILMTSNKDGKVSTVNVEDKFALIAVILVDRTVRLAEECEDGLEERDCLIGNLVRLFIS